MPREYQAIKESLINSGKYSYQEAQRIASATYNKKHPEDPVTRNYDSKSSKPNNKKHKNKDISW